MKSLTGLKRDYYQILDPIMHLDDPEEGLKRLTIIQKRIENSILEKNTKLTVVKDLKKKLNKRIIEGFDESDKH